MIRLIYCSNHATLSCGVQEFARQHIYALKRRGGFEIWEWCSSYPAYLPTTEQCKGWDILFLNFQGGTLGHVQAQHLPEGIKVSLFHHEVNPEGNNAASTSLWDRADLVVGSVEAPDLKHCIEMPWPDWVDRSKVEPPEGRVIVGTTGLRRETDPFIKQVCERNGWEWSVSAESSEWRSTEEEIKRLAACTVNVNIRGGGFCGQSFSLPMLVAARRPLILNRHSKQMSMFEKYHSDSAYWVSNVGCLEEVIKLVVDSGLPAHYLPWEISWASAAKKWEELWKSVL